MPFFVIQREFRIDNYALARTVHASTNLHARSSNKCYLLQNDFNELGINYFLQNNQRYLTLQALIVKTRCQVKLVEQFYLTLYGLVVTVALGVKLNWCL